MPVVLLGNHAALDNGRPVAGEHVITVIVPDSDSLSEGVRNIAHENGSWNRVAAEPPVWVASDSESMASALSDRFGCPIIHMDEAVEYLNQARRMADGESAR